MHWMVCSVLSRLHGRKHKCAFCLMKDHWMWLLSDIVAWDSFWHGTHYLFSDIDVVTATFHVLVNTYFLNFRLALLSVLRVLAHLIYLVIFSNFSVFNFPFLISNNIFLFPGYKFSLLIFDVEFHYQLNVFKAPKMVWYNRRSLMISVKDAKYIHLLSHLSYFLELFIL